MHYAVPKILQAAGLLNHLFTDLCPHVGPLRILKYVPLKVQPCSLRRFLSRSPEGVPFSKITAFNAFGYEYARRRSAAISKPYDVHLWVGKEFCKKILACGLKTSDSVYTYNTAGLEILQYANETGRKAVMEQTIAPMRMELRLMHNERLDFGDWEAQEGDDLLAAEVLCRREEAEWQSANTILCGSEFVKSSIEACGGPGEKCVVVPYGVNVASGDSILKNSRKQGMLRVLTVGAVGLRKGSPYVLEAAKRMQGFATFRMVGHIGVSDAAASELSEHLDLIGSVPRSEIVDHYRWADVFLLPSVCEGSATVTYEALGFGIPVVCTPNAGSVVVHGVDGFIVPERDVASIVECLTLLANDLELLRCMGERAWNSAIENTVAAYGRRLMEQL